MRKANIVFFVILSALCALATAAIGVFLTLKIPELSSAPWMYVGLQETEESRQFVRQLEEGNVFFWESVITTIRELLALVVPALMIAGVVSVLEGYFLEKRATKHYKAVAIVGILVALELTFVGCTLPIAFDFKSGYLGYTDLERVLFLAAIAVAMIGYSASYHWITRSGGKAAVSAPAVTQPT